MKIAIDSDNNGLELKRIIVQYFTEIKYDITDLSYLTKFDKEDYPDVAINMANAIRNREFERGILICGTGLGMAICANKVQGIFAGTCSDVYSAERLIKRAKF